jgi:hypothetical protein
MSEITASRVISLVNSFIPQSTRTATSHEDILSDLGIDSLTTINILLAGSTEFRLDLTRLDSTVRIPVSIGDLMELMMTLHA